MARLLKHADLRLMASASRVPVINGCDEKYHPSQVIADLMTMKEKKGYLEGLKLVYIGVHNNVCNSLIEACTKLGWNDPVWDEELIEEAKKLVYTKPRWMLRKQFARPTSFIQTLG